MSLSLSLTLCELQVWLIHSLHIVIQSLPFSVVCKGREVAEKAQVIKRATHSEENGVS